MHNPLVLEGIFMAYDTRFDLVSWDLECNHIPRTY
jgi:hypothetical protein